MDKLYPIIRRPRRPLVPDDFGPQNNPARSVDDREKSHNPQTDAPCDETRSEVIDL